MWVTLLVLGCGDSSPSEDERKDAGVSAMAVPATRKIEQALAAIVATCSKCDGNVEVRRKGKPYWEPIAIGGLFRDGDWIRTSASGAARIRFVSGGHLDLDAATTLLVEATAAKNVAGETGVRVAVQSGGASGVLDSKSDSPISIRTREGEVRIGPARGTSTAEFRLKPGENGAVEVAVSKGQLVVRSDSEEHNVGSDPGDPTRPAEPKAKPKYRPRVAPVPVGFPTSTAPKIDARFSCTPALRVELEWSAMTGAKAYRVVIARDMSFSSIVASAESKQNHFTFAPSGSGTYVWRVAAKDGRGKFSEFGYARRIFCDAPK